MTTVWHAHGLTGPAAVAEIRARLPDLVPSEARVAQVMLADPTGVVMRSGSSIAAEAGTSTTTVVRCCRRLGFAGYQDLRMALARTDPMPRPVHTDVTEDDAPAELLAKVVAAGAGAVEQSVLTLDTDALGRTIELVRRARRVLFVGIGTAAPLALDAAYRFRHVGIDADAPVDSVMQRIAARQLGPSDVAFALSHAGSAPATLAAAAVASRAGATVVAITSFRTTPLTRLADVLLVAGSQEHSVRVEALASRLVHLTILDAIFMGVVQGDPEGAQRALADVQDMLEQDDL